MSGKPELLAPAGDWEALVAAVENGADAVYLGGKLFNARHSAGNFENLELSRAVHFAHVRGVRVYVTVNTLLEHSEVKEAVRFLHFLYQCGADAAIIQDLGLLRLARKAVPELPLHASTQMTVHNLPALQLLKNAGISRVVLARELSLDALRVLCREQAVYGLAFQGKRYDVGDKMGYLKATVEFALARPDLAEGFREYLRSISLELFQK
jgi:putative protease